VTAPVRGRPRSTEAHQAILRATLELLVEGGFRGLSIDGVAARAGVGKATIYRRWRSKTELVEEAIKGLSEGIELPDTGSLRGDFLAIAVFAMRGTNVRESTLVPRLVAEAAGDPTLHEIFLRELVAPRRNALKVLLKRAQARGELRRDADLELAVDLLIGPIFYRLLIVALGARLPRNYAERSFEGAMTGLAAAEGS
jgi:AcrR family transcriptional regulator